VPTTSIISKRVGMVVRRCSIPAAETSIKRGLGVTSAVRTIADLASRLRLTDAVALLDTALHRRLVTRGQLRDWTATHPGHRGARRVTRTLELADPAAESAMETRLRLLLGLAGLPIRGARFHFAMISAPSWHGRTSTIPTHGSRSSTTAQSIATASPQTTAARTR
jgi:hypothetical protein